MPERIARLVVAVLIIVGGAVHLAFWQAGYRGLPYVGWLFLLNAAASTAVAVALVARRHPATLLAGAALPLGSLVAMGLARTVGLLGFMEANWSADAVRVVAAEVAALVALAVSTEMVSCPPVRVKPAVVRCHTNKAR